MSKARVYAILSVQLAVTAGSILYFGMNPEIARWMIRPGSMGALVPGVALLSSTVSVLIMTFSEKARRVSPLKYQLLALFTAGEALSVGFLSSFYKFRSVLSAMLATTLATTSISLYTILQKNPKYDLSQWGAGLSSYVLLWCCPMHTPYMFLRPNILGLLFQLWHDFYRAGSRSAVASRWYSPRQLYAYQ